MTAAAVHAPGVVATTASLSALNSCNSFCSLRFSSLKFSQHLFSTSQSTSVCFSLVLDANKNLRQLLLHLLQDRFFEHGTQVQEVEIKFNAPCSSVLEPHFHLPRTQVQLLCQRVLLFLQGRQQPDCHNTHETENWCSPVWERNHS